MMEENAIAAGEESGGYAFRGHIPERDGILSALFLLDMMVKTGKNPAELLTDLEDLVGSHFYNRMDIQFDEQERERILSRISSNSPDTLSDIVISEIDTRDGYRFILEDGSWALLRFSGTEPLLRIYAESSTTDMVESLIAECRNLVGV